MDGLQEALFRIADALTLIARSYYSQHPERTVSHVYDLSEYRSFDWSMIGAQVIESDADGPTRIKVPYEGAYRIAVRRSGSSPKFGPAIWYSFADGKTEDGEINYVTVVKFRELAKASPLPDNVKAAIGAQEKLNTSTENVEKAIAWLRANKDSLTQEKLQTARKAIAIIFAAKKIKATGNLQKDIELALQ